MRLPELLRRRPASVRVPRGCGPGRGTHRAAAWVATLKGLLMLGCIAALWWLWLRGPLVSELVGTYRVASEDPSVVLPQDMPDYALVLLDDGTYRQQIVRGSRVTTNQGRWEMRGGLAWSTLVVYGLVYHGRPGLDPPGSDRTIDVWQMCVSRYLWFPGLGEARIYLNSELGLYWKRVESAQ